MDQSVGDDAQEGRGLAKNLGQKIRKEMPDDVCKKKIRDH
jgi:hypothetical protein